VVSSRLDYTSGMRGVLAIATLSGCSFSAATTCSVDRDCAQGLMCGPDHACHALDAPVGLDATGDAAGCQPNHDGQITRAEIVVIVPTTINLRTSTETPVDLHGTTGAGGMRRWDFSGQLTGDHDVAFATAPVAGTWFASHFPTGEFTTPITGQTDLLGVYVAASDRVSILGAASTMSGLTQTVLTYAPAVDALVLPLHVGQHWQGQSTVTGTAVGLPALFTDTYAEDVDASGELVTPYGTFPVLRARLELTHVIGLVTTTTVTYAFVAECFGTVATVTGRVNDTTSEFTTAASVARLAP
jgi:hypothetical protein